jgi:hypothetical protein
LCLTGTSAQGDESRVSTIGGGLTEMMDYGTTRGVEALASDGTFAFFAGDTGLAKNNPLNPSEPVVCDDC